MRVTCASSLALRSTVDRDTIGQRAGLRTRCTDEDAYSTRVAGVPALPLDVCGRSCVMPFCAIVPVDDGKRLLAMTNIRRQTNEGPEKLSNIMGQSISADGGITWTDWRILVDILNLNAHASCSGRVKVQG